MATTSNTLAHWSSSFLAFLQDSRYDGPDTKLRMHNIINIYNLLFIPGKHHDDMGEPPSPHDLIQYMINQGALENEGEFIRISPNT